MRLRCVHARDEVLPLLRLVKKGMKWGSASIGADGLRQWAQQTAGSASKVCPTLQRCSAVCSSVQCRQAIFEGQGICESLHLNQTPQLNIPTPALPCRWRGP